MLALTLSALDQNIVATALPQITGDLGGLQHLTWVVTGYMVASTISGPIYGRVSDLYGRKPAFGISISIFLIGSVLCGLSSSMLQLIIYRTIQGLGAGGLMVLTQTVIADLVSPRDRGRYQGLFTAVFVGCSVAGPLLGGFLTEYASWRLIFYVNLPLGAASLFLIMTALEHRRPIEAPRLDLLGAALLTGGTGTLLLLLSWGGSVYAWESIPVVSLAAAACVFFAMLVPTELRAQHPILPPELFHNRVFVVGAAAYALAAMALFAASVFLPLMFQLLMGAGPSRAGLMVAPYMGGVIVASIAGGRLVSRTGRYKPMPIAGLGCATVCFALLPWASKEMDRVSFVETLLVGLGIGIGLSMPTLTVAIQNAVRRAVLGSATASAAYFRSLGGALGVALAGAVLDWHLQLLQGPLRSAADSVARITGLPPAQSELVMGAYRSGLSAVFEAGACISALALIVVLFIPELPLRSVIKVEDAKLA